MKFAIIEYNTVNFKMENGYYYKKIEKIDDVENLKEVYKEKLNTSLIVNFRICFYVFVFPYVDVLEYYEETKSSLPKRIING